MRVMAVGAFGVTVERVRTPEIDAWFGAIRIDNIVRLGCRLLIDTRDRHPPQQLKIRLDIFYVA